MIMEPMEIETLADLREAIKGYPDSMRVDCWYKDNGKRLVAYAVDGENTDYSFKVFD